MRICSLLIALSLLGGCSWFGGSEILPEPIVVTKIETVPLRIYQPPLPAQIDMVGITWFVITEENAEEKFKEIEKILDGQVVIFALTPDGYEKMAGNLQEMQRYILQQKELILYYRHATSDSEGTTAADWLKNNPE